MSAVLDKFKQAQDDILARMRELEPLVAEYEELKRIAESLQLNPASAPTRSRAAKPASSGRARSQRRTAQRRTARPRRAASGGRREDILRLVGENPGITINQLGKQLGVDPTGLYRPVRALVAEGRIDKQGPSLRPKAA